MELSPNVCPAIAVRNLGQLVVACIAVGVHKTIVVSKILLWHVARSRLVVVVNHDLPVRMLSSAVHPHILLAFGGNVSFLEDLDVCFIAVKNFFFQHLSFESFDKFAEIILTASDDPVCHSCSAEYISKTFPVLFLTVQRNSIDVLLVYHPRSR